jgi:hypothetical protein
MLKHGERTDHRSFNPADERRVIDLSVCVQRAIKRASSDIPKPLITPEKRFQLQTGTHPIFQRVRIARLNILIYDEHVIDLYQLICAPYLMARGAETKEGAPKFVESSKSVQKERRNKVRFDEQYQMAGDALPIAPVSKPNSLQTGNFARKLPI